MLFPGAPRSIKFASGENPKRVYGDRNELPSTRMGNFEVQRAALIEGQQYMKDWDEYNEKVKKGDKDAKAPKRDLKLEALANVLRGMLGDTQAIQINQQGGRLNQRQTDGEKKHVHIERVTQVLRQRIDGRAGPFEATRGAVHDDIDAAEALGDGADHRLHGVSVTDVGLEDLRGDALASHFRRGSLRMISVAGVVDRDRSAIGGEADGNRLADAARAAGDDGYLAVKQLLQSHPFRWSCMPHRARR